jgi:MFS family permease
MNDFHSTNLRLSSFVVSVYLLGYTFGPLLIAPLSELYGRRRIYNTCYALYAIFNVACALSPSLGSLIVFRFFAGATGSAPLALGAGTIADMIRLEKRGAAMAGLALGVLLGPVAGPVGKQFVLLESRLVFVDSVPLLLAGGYLSQAKGWRWSFWILAMAVSTFYFPFLEVC